MWHYSNQWLASAFRGPHMAQHPSLSLVKLSDKKKTKTCHILQQLVGIQPWRFNTRPHGQTWIWQSCNIISQTAICIHKYTFCPFGRQNIVINTWLVSLQYQSLTPENLTLPYKCWKYLNIWQLRSFHGGFLNHHICIWKMLFSTTATEALKGRNNSPDARISQL